MIALALMVFAAFGFAGAGIALAIARGREVTEAETDLGMRTVALLLLLFGGACAFVALGFAAILGFGGAVGWFCYMLAGHRIGIFRIEQPPQYSEPVTERRRIA